MDKKATTTNYTSNYLHFDDPTGQSSQWLIFLTAVQFLQMQFVLQSSTKKKKSKMIN